MFNAKSWGEGAIYFNIRGGILKEETSHGDELLWKTESGHSLEKEWSPNHIIGLIEIQLQKYESLFIVCSPIDVSMCKQYIVKNKTRRQEC